MSKAAIFDLDGTLLDSMGVWNQIDIDFLGRRGIAVPADYMTTVASMQFREIAEYTIARFDLPDTPEQLLAEWDEMARIAYGTTVQAKPGAVEYLRELKAVGVRLGVATTLMPQLRTAALDHLGMSKYFDVIVSVDDAGGVGKSEPDVYLFAARRLGVKPEDCTVFEDLLVAIRSAKSAGMQAWAMYDDSSAADWPEITRVADGALHDFHDAPRLH
ncbi:Haloacid dehalogenase-like hydrolase (HAD superfamily) [Bifidobacterium saguini DSM 23967]|uniref:Beta-phosphoglucomutase n=3 Tax=Bifidobacterium TaxID=1678 RepID=A0A2N5IUF2_9BIFI|nr:MULTISPECIES: HAD family phosphatase [Bifidobacterium]KFI93114.1 Haloacid dehalogenase-like hydrolase (HAD superfamily) [Bifidobacterium saguini DSM 23967]PLS25576.1 beta-phosphoglucomutase [Bifidobacterium imperatoris]QSY57138.1 HAD family phosphatase [Bifidobacterium imperatoris]QTB91264.1 HAD family phosphatase [Bifidobacterium saguini]